MTAGKVITPGGNPVTEVPVLSPRSPPVMIVSPVFVTVELARISKFAADPSGTAGEAGVALLARFDGPREAVEWQRAATVLENRSSSRR
jgi:hypothetical protein